MTFKLNAVASVTLLGTLLGCAPLMPGAPLTGATTAPSRSQTSAVPVKVAQASAVTPAMPSGDALYAQGLTAHGVGQLALASQHYAQALQLAPDHVGALNALAVIYAQSNRIDEALRLFARASELAPGGAHIRNNAGYALLRAGRLDEAESALNKARELDPSNTQTQQNLALLANAKTNHQSTGLAVPSDTADQNGPHLVVVAPNVFELQAPTNTAAEAAGPVQGTTEPSGKDLFNGAELRGVRLEVSNGVGIRRLARRTADRLASEGVLAARLTNARPYRQAKTEIQYVPGQSLAAQALQSRMPVATQAVPASRLNAGVQLRLVLGHDMAGRAITAWLDAKEKQQVATSMQGGWRWS
ncbi:LytR C-terminal domain-containing protein [Rhodoferax sp.]|uniref:LytR C-terminal domain-containing protein n=1 Tax=Rhodoferax sp. TaxID=50421 RepID=UPI00262691B1|nr:LytR C-terminal domain-containing protein [Rhodoferax sp.]MDD3935563.1 tetratricopeptide repeat protein [Rhodoferax sp.]